MRIAALVAALVVAQCGALPLAGENVLLQLDSASGLLPNADDEATVDAEVNQAIQRDVNMDTMAKLGEAPKISKNANHWEKNTMAQINAMSASEVAKAKSSTPDKLSSQFAADIQKAKKVMNVPHAKKSKKRMIDQEVHNALTSPKSAKQLSKLAEQAEMDFHAVSPVALLQEEDQSDDIGEDEVEDDNLRLMSGSNADIMKQINAQIGNMVTSKLGSMPIDTSETANLDKFEKDRQGAAEFLQSKPLDKEAAKKKIEEELKAAQKDLGESKAKNDDADKKEENDE